MHLIEELNRPSTSSDTLNDPSMTPSRANDLRVQFWADSSLLIFRHAVWLSWPRCINRWWSCDDFLESISNKLLCGISNNHNVRTDWHRSKQTMAVSVIWPSKMTSWMLLLPSKSVKRIRKASFSSSPPQHLIDKDSIDRLLAIVYRRTSHQHLPKQINEANADVDDLYACYFRCMFRLHLSLPSIRSALLPQIHQWWPDSDFASLGPSIRVPLPFSPVTFSLVIFVPLSPFVHDVYFLLK